MGIINNLTLPKTKHVKTCNSFVPKTIRDWSTIGSIKNSISGDGFKTRYKMDFLCIPNPIHNYDHKDGDISITRLGLSDLSEYLYTVACQAHPVVMYQSLFYVHVYELSTLYNGLKGLVVLSVWG